MEAKKPFYADLGDLEEDKRIAMIGHMAMDHKKTVAFVTDKEPAGKVPRYSGYREIRRTDARRGFGEGRSA